MAFICQNCGVAHAAGESCAQAKRKGEEFLEEVKHHKFHCDCSNPELHVLEIMRKRGKLSPVMK